MPRPGSSSKPGVAHLTARLREEGTMRRPAAALAEAIEDVGGTLEVGSTGASLRVRAEDLPLAVELAAELIRCPAFPAEDLAWLKRRVAAELAGDEDDPTYRAELTFRRLVYGPRHPLGRDPRGSRRQIGALTLDDVREHHARFFRPGNAFVVAAGDFEPRALTRLLTKHFGDWGPTGTEPAPRPAPLRLGAARVRRVAAPGEQVHIVLGHLGVRRLDPDYDALVLLDHVLGCGPGFTDRLSRRLRDELGLAYSVGGGLTDSADIEPGVFRVYLGTGPAEAARAVEAVLEQVRAVHRGEFDDEEVERARRYLAGAWVFDYQTVAQRAERLLELERWGLPLEEPLRWPERIERITPDQVRAAARRHLHPNRLVRVEHGPLAAGSD
jgi:zinc protease